MDDVEQTPEPITTPDSLITLASFLEIPTTEGIQEAELPLTDGASWKYNLRVPSNTTDQQTALIIGLVWTGEVNDHQTYFKCLLDPSFRDMDAILFVPADNFGLWSHGTVEQRILEFINYVSKHWPINPDRIVITGYSIGGTGSWYYAINHSDIFRASIPMAATHGFNQNAQIPVYGICGDQDELVTCSEMEQLVKNSNSDLSTFEIATNLTHFDACNYVRSLTNGANWLENTVFED